MNAKTLFTVIISGILLIQLTSCNFKGYKRVLTKADTINQMKDTIKKGTFFLNVDTTTLRTLSQAESVEYTIETTRSLAPGKGKVWRVWKSLLRDCMAGQALNFDSLIYLGISNNWKLGSIIVNDDKKIFSPFWPSVIDSLSPPLQKSCVQENSDATCQYSRTVSVNFDFTVKAKLYEAVNAELTAALEHSRRIEASVESWQQVNLYRGMFAKIISEGKDEFIKNFIFQFNYPKTYLITKIIKVHGFSLTYTTSTNISASLKAQLDKGIIQNVGDLGTTIKFSYGGTKTIKATTKGDFTVFVEIMSPKTVFPK